MISVAQTCPKIRINFNFVRHASQFSYSLLAHKLAMPWHDDEIEAAKKKKHDMWDIIFCNKKLSTHVVCSSSIARVQNLPNMFAKITAN